MLFAVKQWLLSNIQAVNIVQLVVPSYMFVSTSGKTTIYNCRSMLAFVGSVCIICPHISIHFPRVLRFLRNAGISTAGADGFSRPRGAALQHHQHVCVCVYVKKPWDITDSHARTGISRQAIAGCFCICPAETLGMLAVQTVSWHSTDYHMQRQTHRSVGTCFGSNCCCCCCCCCCFAWRCAVGRRAASTMPLPKPVAIKVILTCNQIHTN